ncbi:MAG: sensor histidine kinase [Prevotella sp.]|nr:sensor histidine kinase [Prevotella sp.]
MVRAVEVQKSNLEQTAEAESAKGNIASTRYTYIRAFEDYANKGQMRRGVECAAKAAALYYKENYYQEAFDLLRRVDQTIDAKKLSSPESSSLHYFTTKERLQMYIRLHRPESAKDQLSLLESHANISSDEDVKNDFLYTKAIYHYTFGQVAQGNAVFKEMAAKLTASKDYDKVEDAYKTMIANGRRSNNASMVAQSYSSYIAWKDSVSELKIADERAALKKQIADNEAAIAEKDSSLTTRQAIIIGLCVLAAALAAALVVGAVILLRFVLLTRKQKKLIKLANENNALKAKFISNISAQLDPTLQKLDKKEPAVKALLDFSSHIQTLSELENTAQETVETEETSIPTFCEGLMNQIRDKVKGDVTLKVNAPKMSMAINHEYVSHILSHLLSNAAEYTPAGGTISLDYKKRGAHTHQFLVSDTGCGIPEEERDEIFKPFRKVRDLTTGDGLGLPICKQMALKMNGDLNLDPEFVKGTRFVLELHV